MCRLVVGCCGGRICGVSADLVPDDLWERVAPLLPVRPPRRQRYPGRLPADDRAALRGIVYVLCKSVSRRDVPAAQGAKKSSSLPAGEREEWREGVLFVVALPGLEAVVELAEEAVEQVALSGVVPVSVFAPAPVVDVGSR
ncbi:transposase [Streptomyces sp. NPDC056437]|uniref:transposase n=1 Tax=Streptomyces sp. NPDC056437 TaxID=3345816 RepID=UPI00369071F8